MNNEAKQYWKDFWGNEQAAGSVSACQFGVDPDTLAQLVIDGIKTATCSGHIFTK